MNLSNYKIYSPPGYVFLLLAVCLFCIHGCSSERTEKSITEAEVRELADKVEVAAKSHDVEAIIDNMSEKVQIRARVMASGQIQSLAFNRDQYRDLLIRTYAAGTNYTYSRQKTQIQISPDGKTAVVSTEVTESLTLNGKVIRSVGTEVSTLGRENGKLVIQYVEADGKQD